MKKQRCQYSKEGLETFGKQKCGYVINKSKDNLCWRVLWDGQKTIINYEKDFIDVNPLIKLFTDENGIEKEKSIEEEEKKITPEIILSIEFALNKLRETGISHRGLEVLVKDYCGVKVSMRQVKKVINAIEKLKSYYFNAPTSGK